MRYYVFLDEHPGDEPVPVDVVERADGTLEASIGGRAVAIDASAAGRGLSVRVDGRVVDLAVGANEAVADGRHGRRSSARVESDRSRSGPRSAAGGSSGPMVVRSPMPGRIVRILIDRGAAVQPRQGLLVLEAMKMENEVRAAAAGTIAAVHVAVGDAVEANAKLVTLE